MRMKEYIEECRAKLASSKPASKHTARAKSTKPATTSMPVATVCSPLPAPHTVAKIRKRSLPILAWSPTAVWYAAMLARRHVVLVLFSSFSSLEKQGEVRRKGGGGVPCTHPKLRLKPWRALSDYSKIQVAIEAALLTEGYTLLSVNLNVSPSVDIKLRSESNLNYVRDEFRRAVTQVLQGYPICFVLVQEATYKEGRIHFHGALMVPDALIDDSLLTRLEESIQARPSVNRYRKRYLNKAVKLKYEYDAKVDGTDGATVVKPVSGSWARYCTKNYSQGGAYTMSPEFTGLAKVFLEYHRSPALPRQTS